MEPGPKVDETAESPHEPPPGLKFLFGTARWVGFLMLVAPAMAVLAAVVLLPPYAQLQEHRHQLELMQARVGEAQDYLDAGERLNNALTDDVQLTKRLLMRYEGVVEAGHVVVKDPSLAPARPPGTITLPAHPRPQSPTGWALDMSAKVSQPGTRRGLFLLAAVAMLAALFLFSPPEKYVQSPEASRQ